MSSTFSDGLKHLGMSSVQPAAIKNVEAKQKRAKVMAARLAALRDHLPQDLASQAQTLSNEFQRAATRTDSAIMKAAILDAQGTLDAFLVAVSSSVRDRQLVGDQ